MALMVTKQEALLRQLDEQVKEALCLDKSDLKTQLGKKVDLTEILFDKKLRETELKVDGLIKKLEQKQSHLDHKLEEWKEMQENH